MRLITPSTVFFFSCFVFRTNIAHASRAFSTVSTQASSGISTTRRITTMTTHRQRLCKATSSISFIPILSTNVTLHSIFWSRAKMGQTLLFCASMPVHHMKTSHSKLSTEIGSMVASTAFVHSFRMALSNCGSIFGERDIVDKSPSSRPPPVSSSPF